MLNVIDVVGVALEGLVQMSEDFGVLTEDSAYLSKDFHKLSIVSRSLSEPKFTMSKRLLKVVRNSPLLCPNPS